MKRLSFIIISLLSVGCTDADWQGGISSLGNKHKVTLYSGGKVVKEWRSTGKVQVEDQAGGYKFVDEETGLLVRTNGDVIVELLNE